MRNLEILQVDPIRVVGEPASAFLPRGIYVELTDRCNLACPMCRASHIKGNVLPLQTFSEMAEALLPTARFVDLRGWGESLILSRFEDYLDVAIKYPARVKLITNASLNKPHLWKRLARDGVYVGISFDAAEEQLFRRLRGGADLTKVMENVRSLVEENEKAGREPADCVYFCITVGGENVVQVPEIVDLGITLGIRRFKLEPLWAPAEDPFRLENHAEAVHATEARLREIVARAGVSIEYSASLLAEDVVPAATQKVCIHPWEYLYVNCRGRLGFCDHLNGREEFTFGAWGEGGFQAFWNGPEMTRLRAEHLRRLDGEAITQCPDCNWCYDRRYMDLEDWVEPSWDNYRIKVQ